MIQLDEKNPNERLGEFLARVRESQGLSIDDLSDRTKISVKMLHFIEASDWKSLPVEAYVRSYLNSVSTKLGLDPKGVLKLYAEEVGSNFVTPDMEPMKNIAPMTDEEKQPRSKAVPIAIVVIVALFIVGLHFVTKGDAADSNANPPAVVAAEDSSEMQSARMMMSVPGLAFCNEWREIAVSFTNFSSVAYANAVFMTDLVFVRAQR